MTGTSNSAGISPNVSRTAIYRAFGAALRLYVGVGKRHRYKEIERGAGVSARMIEAYRHEPEHHEWREPKIEEILSVAGFIGPDFLNEILPELIGQGVFWVPDESEPPPGQFAADASEDTTEIVRRAADGVFCADDRKHLAAVGRRQIERGQVLVAMGRKVA
ncbi:hypothetical protein M527_06560 [Sphingobium indicum IP26]|uniref:Uncharacterized protein n=1 Tax=Sphingobium indicum F2 TaxID=1450518 RepID=A0A8E1C3H0_9SPHN|nr:hypothetical protein [Sphingobium indicum]EPR09785.1 hypothetical protein M527_06560 [Sphingobium indicum IP26]KER37267.1 hypothetical protein AL00_06225 [Sphingobium indicum F2]